MTITQCPNPNCGYTWDCKQKSDYRRTCPKCQRGWVLTKKQPSADEVDADDLKAFEGMSIAGLEALVYSLQCVILRRKSPECPTVVPDKKEAFGILTKIITGKKVELSAKAEQAQAAKDLEARRSFYQYDEA